MHVSWKQIIFRQKHGDGVLCEPPCIPRGFGGGLCCIIRLGHPSLYVSCVEKKQKQIGPKSDFEFVWISLQPITKRVLVLGDHRNAQKDVFMRWVANHCRWHLLSSDGGYCCSIFIHLVD